MTDSQKAVALERYRTEIAYCIKNEGKSFDSIDVKEIGNPWGYEHGRIITPGLIAEKYAREYHNHLIAAEWYCKDWEAYKKYKKALRQAQSAGRPPPTFWVEGGMGDFTPHGYCVDAMENAGRYTDALHYQREMYEDWLMGFDGETRDQKVTALERDRKTSSDVNETYQAFKKGLDELGALAKAGDKLKPIAPAVRMHEWFYSGEKSKVLAALGYYFEHQVRFMLEKAKVSKDKRIAAKAASYLKKLKLE